MRLRFGDCTYDADARELRRAGGTVPLSPRAFELLRLLLARRPRALTQQSLRDALWPDTLVGYTSLAQLVTEVRKAIGDRTLVRTIPRYGYAFVGEADEEPAAGARECVGAFVSEAREYPVPAGETLVGRGDACGVRLPSARVSRVHARVRAAGGDVTIEDAGSKNGTWLNGARCDRPSPLVDGDEVAFGTFRVVYRAGDPGGGSTRTGRPR